MTWPTLRKAARAKGTTLLFRDASVDRLQLVANKFLANQNRDNLVGVGFVSSSSLIPVSDGLLESGDTSYFFSKKESPFWHTDFSGMFSISE